VGEAPGDGATGDGAPGRGVSTGALVGEGVTSETGNGDGSARRRSLSAREKVPATSAAANKKSTAPTII
jgi:hypothetical protein